MVIRIEADAQTRIVPIIDNEGSKEAFVGDIKLITWDLSNPCASSIRLRVMWRGQWLDLKSLDYGSITCRPIRTFHRIPNDTIRIALMQNPIAIECNGEILVIDNENFVAIMKKFYAID